MPALTIDIIAKLAQFQTSLNQITSSAQKAGTQIENAFSGIKRLAGAVGVGLGAREVVQTFRELALEAEKLGERAQAVGVTASALQSLQFAAKTAGVESSELDRAITKLNVAIVDLGNDTGEARAGFAALGLSLKDLQGLSPDQAFLKLADAFSKFQDDGNKSAVLAKVLSERFGPKFAALLNEGAGGIQKLQKEFTALGGGFSEEFIENSGRFNDNMNRLGVAMEAFKVTIGGPLIASLAEFTDQIVAATKATGSLLEGLSAFASAKIGGGAVVELRQIQKEIDAIEAGRKKLASGDASLISKAFNALPGVKAIGDIELNQMKTQRDALKAIVERDANAGIEALSRGLPEPPKKKIGALVDPASAEKARRAAEEAARAEAALQEARAKVVTAGETRLAQVRLELLDRFHAEGLIGEEDFWQRRLEVQRAATAASIEEINKELALRREAVAKAEQALAKAPIGEKRDEARTGLANARKEELEATNRLQEATEKLGNETVLNTLDAQKAMEGYKDEVTRTAAELLQLQGRTAEAVKLTTDLDQRTARRRATAQGDTAQIINLDALRIAREKQAEFNQEQERGREILRQLAAEEERIQNSRRVGATGELTALNETDEARKTAVARLQEISNKLQNIASVSGLPELTRQAQEFGLQIETLASQSNLLIDKIREIGQTGLGDFFGDVVTGSKSAKEAFKDFTKSVGDQLARLASQEISRSIFQAVLGGSGGGGGGGAGAAASIIAALFGAGGGGGAGAGLNLSSYGGAFQHGGSFMVGGAGGADSKLVSFRATPGERVTVSPPGQSGGGTNVININVAGNTDQRTASQVAGEAGRAVARARRRNG